MRDAHLDTLGRLFYLKRKYSKAEQFFQKAQSIREEALGVEHPAVFSTINNLAEELYTDALAKRIRILGPEHPAVAQTFHSMAHLSYFQSKYAHAEQEYYQVLTIREKVLGAEHPDVAQTLHGLAEIHFWKWKKFEQAESLLQRAIAIYEKAQLIVRAVHQKH